MGWLSGGSPRATSVRQGAPYRDRAWAAAGGSEDRARTHKIGPSILAHKPLHRHLLQEPVILLVVLVSGALLLRSARMATPFAVRTDADRGLPRLRASEQGANVRHVQPARMSLTRSIREIHAPARTWPLERPDPPGTALPTPSREGGIRLRTVGSGAIPISGAAGQRAAAVMCSRAARHGGRRCQAGSFPGRKRGHWWVGTLDFGLDGRCGRWWAPGSPVKMGSPWTATSNGSPAIAPTTLSNPARAGARPPKAAVTGSGRAHGARSASRRPSQRSVRRRLSARRWSGRAHSLGTPSTSHLPRCWPSSPRKCGRTARGPRCRGVRVSHQYTGGRTPHSAADAGSGTRSGVKVPVRGVGVAGRTESPSDTVWSISAGDWGIRPVRSSACT